MTAWIILADLDSHSDLDSHLDTCVNIALCEGNVDKFRRSQVACESNYRIFKKYVNHHLHSQPMGLKPFQMWRVVLGENGNNYLYPLKKTTTVFCLYL